MGVNHKSGKTKCDACHNEYCNCSKDMKTCGSCSEPAKLDNGLCKIECEIPNCNSNLCTK